MCWIFCCQNKMAPITPWNSPHGFKINTQVANIIHVHCTASGFFCHLADPSEQEQRQHQLGCSPCLWPKPEEESERKFKVYLWEIGHDSAEGPKSGSEGMTTYWKRNSRAQSQALIRQMICTKYSRHNIMITEGEKQDQPYSPQEGIQLLLPSVPGSALVHSLCSII